jgi:thiamine-monophosphate kinase
MAMEQSFLAWLKGRQRLLPQVRVGIGDDGAVIDVAGGSIVATVDSITDGVDFRLAEVDPRRIGHKALAISLSDIAAMAATPTATLVNLQLPREDPSQLAAAIYEGLLSLAQRHHVAIAGGDITVYDGPLSISTTVIGNLPSGRSAWLRRGAEVGDALIVSGSFGGSILGHHLDFEPRVALALQIAAAHHVHAAMDVSDGLMLDLDRLCAASGVGVQLELEKIPIREAALTLAQGNADDALEHAMGDGEDFELLLAVSAEEASALLASDLGVPLTRIGTFTSRTGLWTNDAGHLRRLNPRGYVHGVR